MILQIFDAKHTEIFFRSDVNQFSIPWTEYQGITLPLAMMLEVSILARIASALDTLEMNFQDGHKVVLWF